MNAVPFSKLRSSVSKWFSEQMCIKPALCRMLQGKYDCVRVGPCPRSGWGYVVDIRIGFDNSNGSFCCIGLSHIYPVIYLVFLLISKWVAESVPFTPEYFPMHINRVQHLFIILFLLTYILHILKYINPKCTIQWGLTNV